MIEGTFLMTVDLGNDAMCQFEELADAIRRVADAVQEGYGGGRVKDENGNTVGKWELDA